MALLAFSLLSACGGGGGGGGTSNAGAQPSSSGGPSYSLSGTLSVPGNAAIDSDTNDPQQPGRLSNDDTLHAQALATPVQLVGSVNEALKGPAGANFSAGDDLDVFVSSLVAGQIIELQFSGDVLTNDVDLYLLDKNTGNVVGTSDGVSASECIRVGRSGDYYIAALAYVGAAIYNLRVGAPGESSSCAVTSSATQLMVPGEVLVKPLAGARGASLAQATAHSLGASLSANRGARSVQRLRLPESASLRAAGLRSLGRQRPLTLGGASKSAAGMDEKMQLALDTLQYAKRLRATGQFDYVEPNYLFELQALTGNFPPNDPDYFKQRWHYEQINLPSAMERITALAVQPTQRPIVAVIDSGIVNDHPDLQPQIAGGYSFITVNNAGDGNTASPNDPSVKTDNPSWHGSHVAGTVAAASYNSSYGAGVAPMAQLMPLRVFAPGKSASLYDIYQAIAYAAGLSNNSNTLPARRADVINMSLGASISCPASFADAIAQARAQGVVVVAAAGNDARNDQNSPASLSAPANCAGVISVAALDAAKQQTYYSNSGGSLSLAAPGGDSRYSTTGTGLPDNVFSTVAAFNSSNVRVASFGGLQGTSMAAPHVAGVIALMRYVNNAMTPGQIDTLLAQGKLSDDINSVGRDNATGYGLINARKAVDEALALAGNAGNLSGIVVASPSSLDFGSTGSSAQFSLQATAATSETVSSVSSSSAAVSVAPLSIDPASGLGSYQVSIDRSQLPVGNSAPTLTVTTSSRSFTVQLSIYVAPNSSAISASFGRLYLLFVDSTSQAIVGRTSAVPLNGVYAWSGSVPAGKLRILAGSDLDNDGFICQSGEVCGAYPVLANGGAEVTVTGNLSGLNFSVATIASQSNAASFLSPLSLSRR